MKYWRGYLTAAILVFFTWALKKFAETHTQLIDRVYPYVTRMVQSWLADWTSTADFCLWQLLLVLIIIGFLAGIVIMIIIKGNPIQWGGWVLACASLVFFLHTAIYGLNTYAGPLADDIRMNVTDFTIAELEEAAGYYRDKANELSVRVSRDGTGKLQYSDFATMADQAGEGYQKLVYERYFSVFAGSMVPVKKLGWADMYTSMQIDGVTMPLTGEAAVNPNIPVVAIPFTMCHEMAHRMSIAIEQDANFAAFLACDANSSLEFRYSAYFMAYRYCYNALVGLGAVNAAQRVSLGVGEELRMDLADYREFYAQHRDEKAAQAATTINDTYIKVSGDERGTDSYGDVADLLVGWYIQEVVLPQSKEEDIVFDPYDEDWVFPKETTPAANE